MQSPTSKSVPAEKRPYEAPKLTTHGDVSKLTQNPWKPKKNGRWADSEICVN